MGFPVSFWSRQDVILGVIRAAAAAEVGVEDEQRFNFGHAAD